MGQSEIIKFLEKHKGKWFTSDELAIGTKSSVTTIKSPLLKLMEHGAIIRRIKKNVRLQYEYKYGTG